jgi:hypothetical protein
MSYDIAVRALRLEAPERLAHTEYCSNYALVRAVTGLDPRENGSAWRAFHDAWDLDLLWCTNDGPVSWGERGRVTDMGHAEFLEGGIDRRDTVTCPFQSVEEVWEFDAVAEYGLLPFDDLVDYYREWHRATQEANPNQLITGGYYKTIVSGAIDIFGWDMLLLAAADQEKFARVLESIFRQSLHHYRAWAQTPIAYFICHDDMVWTEGPFVHPRFYRSVIFPFYKRLWDVLREAGKKVLFCSDGNWTMFVDDIAAAGAHGFIFEPLVDLDLVVSRYGKTHAILGSKVDCRTLTFGGNEDIAREVEATMRLAKDCPGFFCAVGNHIPSNVPVENAQFYMEKLREHWRRD